MTVWPRLEIGNSSVTPCKMPEDYRLKVTDVQRRDARAGGAGHESGMSGQHAGV